MYTNRKNCINGNNCFFEVQLPLFEIIHSLLSIFSGAFRIDPVLGKLYSNGTIDREENSFYNLTVIAYDGGNPVNSAKVQVSVTVLDVNDNSPIFSNKSYQIEVYENVPIGRTISQVSK